MCPSITTSHLCKYLSVDCISHSKSSLINHSNTFYKDVYFCYFNSCEFLYLVFSGVILSQLFRGFTKSIREKNELDIPVFADAFEKAVERLLPALDS